MAMSSGGRDGLRSDMNVTPLIDVLLVLLVIFMVIIPLSQMAYDVQIPQEAKIDVRPSDPTLILAVNETGCPIAQPLNGGVLPECTVYLNKEPVRAAELGRRLKEIFDERRSSDKLVFLAAQDKLNYEGVMRILDIARSAVGADLKVGIVTDERLAGVGA